MMQDKPIQAADVKGLALNNNCSSSQAKYTNPVYLVNMTNFSGMQPLVMTTKSIHSMHSIGDSHDEDRYNVDHNHGRHGEYNRSAYNMAFAYPQHPQAIAPAVGLSSSTAPQPEGSISFGGTY